MRKKTVIKRTLTLIFSVLIFASFGKAQTAEVAVALNEQFFDTLLDAIFKNFNAPQFPLAKNEFEIKIQNAAQAAENTKTFAPSYKNAKLDFSRSGQTGNPDSKNGAAQCSEVIRLHREISGVKTAVRFREGRIYTPIAFSGSYNPPLIGCIDFQGWAEAVIDLEYERQSRKLIGRVRVLSVNLGGVTNLASGVLSRLVQGSIDKKINPIEILQTDKLSFLVPIQNAGGSLRMRAVGIRHEISEGVLNINIAYEFSRGN